MFLNNGNDNVNVDNNDKASAHDTDNNDGIHINNDNNNDNGTCIDNHNYDR